MKVFFLFLFLPKFLFSQETKVRVLSEEKGADNTIVTIAELIVQNNSFDPICIRISTGFLINNLSKDTIELATFGNDSHAAYDLLFTKDDMGLKLERIHGYPIVLNGFTSFVATLKLVRKSTCNNQILEVSYLKSTKDNYDKILDQTMRGLDWDGAIKLKFQTKEIHF
jgi:hypothetical protein